MDRQLTAVKENLAARLQDLYGSSDSKDIVLHCIRPSCGAPLSLYTASGRKKNLFRLKEQKYCTAACSRLHYIEMLKEEQRKAAEAEAIFDKFIRGDYSVHTYQKRGFCP